jgi:hypothetical protein
MSNTNLSKHEPSKRPGVIYKHEQHEPLQKTWGDLTYVLPKGKQFMLGRKINDTRA